MDINSGPENPIEDGGEHDPPTAWRILERRTYRLPHRGRAEHNGEHAGDNQYAADRVQHPLMHPHCVSINDSHHKPIVADALIVPSLKNSPAFSNLSRASSAALSIGVVLSSKLFPYPAALGGVEVVDTMLVLLFAAYAFPLPRSADGNPQTCGTVTARGDMGAAPA